MQTSCKRKQEEMKKTKCAKTRKINMLNSKIKHLYNQQNEDKEQIHLYFARLED